MLNSYADAIQSVQLRVFVTLRNAHLSAVDITLAGRISISEILLAVLIINSLIKSEK